MKLGDTERKKTDDIENRLCNFTSTKFGEMQIIEGDMGTRDRTWEGGSGKKMNGGVRGIIDLVDASHDPDRVTAANAFAFNNSFALRMNRVYHLSQ